MLNQSRVSSISRAGVWQVCYQMSLSLQLVLGGLWSHLSLNESHLLGFVLESEEHGADTHSESDSCVCLELQLNGWSASLGGYCADASSPLMLPCLLYDECQSE